jgi:sigma-B regulation protein RsbU (phosphoserine phosphatase)
MPSRRLHILLVEDNPGDARLIREELREPSLDHEIMHYATLTEAIERISAHAPGDIDVVLLDLSLPDVQGIDSVMRVRNAAPWMPIVVLTGLEDEGLAFRAVEEGVQDYLVKGRVNGSVLVRALRYAIERKRVEEGQRREEEAERTAKFREMFMGVLGHDLRNPLQSITLGSGLLAQADDLPPRHAKSVQRMASSAQRMVRMIDDLLDFTRARLGGGFSLDKAQVDAAEICRQVTDELEVSFPNRTIETSVIGNVGGVWDRDRIAQVASNLISNALSYSPPGTTVRVALRDAGEHVELEVHNQGPCIPDDALAHLFDPFYRADPSRRGTDKGLGLGLYITQQIVHAHDGTVTVQSTEKDGTTFTVSLPRA